MPFIEMKNAHFPVMMPKGHPKDHNLKATCIAKKTKPPEQQKQNKPC